MGQVHEKVVLKYTMTVNGETCVMMDSRTQRQELSATCWDTGRSLSLRMYYFSVFSVIERNRWFYCTSNHQTEVWPCCRAGCHTSRDVEVSYRPNQPYSPSAVCQCLDYSKVPCARKGGIIISLYKGRGTRNERASYRPITLLSVSGMFFAHVLLSRIDPLFVAKGGLSSRDLLQGAQRWMPFWLYDCYRRFIVNSVSLCMSPSLT